MITSIVFANSKNGASFTLNDLDSPAGRFETDVDVRNEDRERAQDHGNWPTFSYFGARTIRIEGNLFGESSADYIVNRRALLKALMPNRYGERTSGTLTIQFTDMTEAVTADCIISSYPELPIEALGPTFTTYQVIFKSFDPILYGATEQSQDYNLTLNPIGRYFNKTYSKTYSGASDLGTFTQNGDVETYPIVKIYGPCTNPELQKFNADGTVEIWRLIYDIDGPEIVTVDMKNHTVESSYGTAGLFDLTTGSDWWFMDAGDNSIRFFAFDGLSPSKATFTWYNAYML